MTEKKGRGSDVERGGGWIGGSGDGGVSTVLTRLFRVAWRWRWGGGGWSLLQAPPVELVCM